MNKKLYKNWEEESVDIDYVGITGPMICIKHNTPNCQAKECFIKDSGWISTKSYPETHVFYKKEDSVNSDENRVKLLWLQRIIEELYDQHPFHVTVSTFDWLEEPEE